MTERYRIASGPKEGCGGFLNPPTHPEHTMSVQGFRRGEMTSLNSLSSATKEDQSWIPADIRKAAANILRGWKAPPIDSPGVKDWIHQVLGYFRDSYRGEGAEPLCWGAGNLRFNHKPADDEDYPVWATVDNHAGVHLIRKYYPEYQPTDEDFANAYWGTNPKGIKP